MGALLDFHIYEEIFFFISVGIFGFVGVNLLGMYKCLGDLSPIILNALTQ
jgi:hypothetical protein